MRNEWDRNLKNEYLFITYDATDSLYGQRFCSLSNYDGTNKTISGKLYLKNVDLQPLQSELFQVHFEPVYGITSQEGLMLNIVSTNHVVNSPVYSLTP